MTLTREQAWQKAAYLLSVASGFDPKSKTTLIKLQQEFNDPFNRHELIFKLAVEQKFITKVGKSLIKNESAENMFNDEVLQDFANDLAKRLEYPSGTSAIASMIGHGVDENGDDVFQLTVNVHKAKPISKQHNKSKVDDMGLLKELLCFDVD